LGIKNIPINSVKKKVRYRMALQLKTKKIPKQLSKLLDDDNESLTEPTAVEVWLSDFIQENLMKKVMVQDAFKNYNNWLDTIHFTEERQDFLKFKGEVRRRYKEMGYEREIGRMRNHSNPYFYWIFYEKNENN